MSSQLEFSTKYEAYQDDTEKVFLQIMGVVAQSTKNSVSFFKKVIMIAQLKVKKGFIASCLIFELGMAKGSFYSPNRQNNLPNNYPELES